MPEATRLSKGDRVTLLCHPARKLVNAQARECLLGDDFMGLSPEQLDAFREAGMRIAGLGREVVDGHLASFWDEVDRIKGERDGALRNLLKTVAPVLLTQIAESRSTSAAAWVVLRASSMLRASPARQHKLCDAAFGARGRSLAALGSDSVLMGAIDPKGQTLSE